nr:hypothetical protein [Tanacetum cinerariifolium]
GDEMVVVLCGCWRQPVGGVWQWCGGHGGGLRWMVVRVAREGE